MMNFISRIWNKVVAVDNRVFGFAPEEGVELEPELEEYYRPLERQIAFDAIDDEIDCQRDILTDDEYFERSTGDYLTILRYYLSQADEALTVFEDDEQALDVVRRIAAVAVSCMEVNGTMFREDD